MFTLLFYIVMVKLPAIKIAQLFLSILVFIICLFLDLLSMMLIFRKADSYHSPGKG